MRNRTDGSVERVQVVSHELPIIPTGAVERTHVLDTIAQIASDDAPVVFVEGEAGCGATTLMAQLCTYQKEKCFYLFIKPASRFSYSLDYLRLLLAEQFASYLCKELSTDQAVDVGLYDALLLAVKKKKGRQTVFFVIDGLQQVSDNEKVILKSIFTEVLPIGIQGFRFLITGRRDIFEGFITGVRSKNYQVQKMSEAESLQILRGIEISESNLNGILKICRGLPGRLASVCRIVKNDSDANKLLSADLSDYPDFISIELKVIDGFNEKQKLALSLLAFSRYPLSRKRLMDLSSATECEVQEISEKCEFLHLQDDTPYSDFESETYRRYADRKLEKFRGQALNLQIDYLSSNPSSPEAVQFLPAYYQSLNQQQAILDLLDSDHYSRLLDATNSINALRSRAAIGARSALELKQAAGIFQFALQRSIFFDVACCRGFQSRVGALVALGRSSQALDLAAQAPTTEIRLKMLSEYARRTIESGRNLDDQIVESIKDLADKVDLSDLPEEMEALAENIAFFDTELAMSLLDRVSTNKSDVGARDRALMKLSFAAVNSSRPNTAIFEKTRSQVSDERHRSLIAFIASYFGGVGLAEVRVIAENLSPDRRIFFLRCVLAGPELGANALEIVDYALGEIVGNASYLPKVRDLADFATPLAYSIDADSRLPDIIRRFEAQLGLVEKSSSSIHLTDLTIKLAIGESRFDMTLARRRVLDAYFNVAEIASLEIKVECLAILLKALKQIDTSGDIEAQEGISQVLREDLLKTVGELLENTASHFEVVRGSLRAIAEYDLDAAIKIADQLNTVSSRDDAYQLILETLVRSPCAATSTSSAMKLLKLITEGWRRDRAVAAVVRSAVRGTHKHGWPQVLGTPVKMIIDSNTKAEAAIDVLQSQAKISGQIDEDLLAVFRAAAEEVPCQVDAADLFFKAAAAVAKADVQASSLLYDRAEAILADATLSSESATTTVSICLSLLLRASRIIIKFGLFDVLYVERFSRLCEVLPDLRTRIAYYVDLATKAACESQFDLARQLINKYCSPVLSGLNPHSVIARQVAMNMFVAVYMTRGKVALNLLDGAGVKERDIHLAMACKTIICKVTDGDGWTGDMENVAISYEEVESVVELLSEIITDSYISQVVGNLTEATCSKLSRRKITRQQRAALREKLLTIVKSKLPQPYSVGHDGYLVEVEAYIARLVDTSSESWAALETRAANIPNMADRVLVKMELAKSLPPKMSVLARKSLGECRSEIAAIPFIYDRQGRLEAFVEAAKAVDPGLSKGAIADALEFTFQLDSKQAADKSRQRLFDMAEQIDPKMLDDLINGIDDDPARIQAKRDLQKIVKVKKVGRRISSARRETDGSDTQKDVLPSAAWKNLESLVAGRSEPLAPDLLHSYVFASGDWNLQSSYPVLSWYLENISRRVMRSDDVVSKVLPLWEVLLLSTELAVNVIQKTNAYVDRTIFSSIDKEDGLVVNRFNGREDAMNYLRNWFRDLTCPEDDHLIFCDPYFSANDIDFLRIVLAECPQRRLIILTSRKALVDMQNASFEAEWAKVMDQDPPEVEVIGISDVDDDRSPIHDRWLLSSHSGLRIGTSLNGLGSRFSEISSVADVRVVELRALLNRFVQKNREVDGSRMRYLTYTI